MRLLVSVRGADEAAAALAGGADVVDAKEPAAGPLGAVTAGVLRQIVAIVAGQRPVTAALGDAADERTIASAAGAAGAAGAALVKVGLAGVDSVTRAGRLLAAAVDGASGAGTIAVAYADYGDVGALPPEAILDAAVRAGAVGLLVDTAGKRGRGLLALADVATVHAWVEAAHAAGLLAAVAGQLTMTDAGWLATTGADVVGVRGAACVGGRSGQVAADRVASMATALATARLRHRPGPVRPRESDRFSVPGRTT